MPPVEALKWTASISGVTAAFMVSLDCGRRVTGWGFALFVGSSLCWIAGALMSRDGPLWSQNLVLFGINLLGVYRYLIRKRPPSDRRRASRPSSDSRPLRGAMAASLSRIGWPRARAKKRPPNRTAMKS